MKKFTLKEIEAVLKQEGIGRHSSQYVLNRLDSMDNRGNEVLCEVVDIKMEVKQKPNAFGVKVAPSSVNNVHFKHNDEEICLHFLSNGNIGLTKESNKEQYIEIDKNQLCSIILSKF